MKMFAPETAARFAAGEVDGIDALTLVFDSGIVNVAIGVRGQFTWDDPTLGEQTFYGGGALTALDVPENALGPESRAITARLFESSMVVGSDIPVNVFDDGVSATIDEELWEGRTAILSIFWLSKDGVPIEREQVAVRQIDAMPLDWDEEGNPVRSLILEEPDIAQREIEGKTSNAEFQALIDPTDRAFEHVGTTKNQKINFGKRPEEAVA
ncbi:MAG: hypothetical protein HY371_07130 [Devosia nanyangense]|nr:hypothetical protein [Devosia nanyangense]